MNISDIGRLMKTLTPKAKLNRLYEYCTQKELAKSLGTTQATISRILCKGQKPGYDLINSINTYYESFDFDDAKLRSRVVA